MATYKLSYNDQKSGPNEEQITADYFQENGDWTDFKTRSGGGSGSHITTVRIRSSYIDRIELLQS